MPEMDLEQTTGQDQELEVRGQSPEGRLRSELRDSDEIGVSLRVENWGLIDYRAALARQEELVEQVAAGGPHVLVVCCHPAVVTIGRRTPVSDYAGWKGEVVEVSRGGRATYHGPGQIVLYPIVNLNRCGDLGLPMRDLHGFMRALGQAVVQTVAELGIAAEYRQGEDTESEEARHLTGVWVGSRKLASIGVAARKWVTFHGLALNFASDPEAFRGIQPCGFSSQTMVSVEELLHIRPERSQMETVLVEKWLKQTAPVKRPTFAEKD